MKKRGFFIIAVAGILSLRCDMNTTNPEAGNTENKLTYLESDADREDPDVSASIVDTAVAGNTDFAIDLFKELAQNEQDENIFFSPISISVALGMAWGGAEGETKEGMAEVMRFYAEDKTHAAFNKLDREMEAGAESHEDIDLGIVNSSWGAARYKECFKASYLDLLAKNYGSSINIVPFFVDPEWCRDTINSWVSDRTNSLIKDLLSKGSITVQTALVLVNAVYFKGLWFNQFDETLTAPENFYKADGDTVKADMMALCENEKTTTQYAMANESCTAVELPYKGDRFSMLLIRPRDMSIHQLEEDIDRDFINQVVGDLDSMHIYFKMPKFEVKWESSTIMSNLSDLGMDSWGVVSGMVKDSTPLFSLGGIKHKAYINVDESGTEAAAATAVIFVESTEPVEKPVFVMNKPFLYFIRDRKTGSILFAGRMMDPTL